MNKTATDAREIVIECIYTLFEDFQNPTPEQVADAVVKGLGIEQEWALAEYDPQGELDSINHQDWDFNSVFRLYEKVIREMDEKKSRRSVGIVSRLLSPWRVV